AIRAVACSWPPITASRQNAHATADHGSSKRSSMRKADVRGCLAWMGAVLMVSALVSCTHAARSAAASPPSQGLSKSQRIQVLTRALMLMQREYGKLRSTVPGPEDVLDYQAGDLWRRGIDGTGTTVAVIEAWNSPLLAKEMAS